MKADRVRALRLVLGDQLSHDNPALADIDPSTDLVVMIEAASESTAVWSSKPRIAIFLAAMRHFAVDVAERGWPLRYVRIDEGPHDEFARRLADVIAATRPELMVVCEPGEWRTLAMLQDVARAADVALELRTDTHFLCTRDAFAAWAGGRKSLRMEFFYRWMRREHDVLVDDGGEPVGGRWNLDEDNRKGFGRGGPGFVPTAATFPPDEITREVFALVESRFADHPGSLASFAWPVTRAQALVAVECFVEERLDAFGPHQDAMWSDMPFGWHALLSSSMNLKLVGPREVVSAALARHARSPVPFASLEGFIRQIIGWREFIRGMYWLDMPAMRDANHYGARRALPTWYWTADVGMNCMRRCIGQTLEHGYAHHIQRLMITGQFALLSGIDPRQVADWYLAVYVDAVEWVELPNVVGMALHADGGRFTSKPYIASGAYVNRMSDYCRGCVYDPAKRIDDEKGKACPFTTLYWNFVDTNRAALVRNPRTMMMVRHVDRWTTDERAALRAHAQRTLDDIDLL